MYNSDLLKAFSRFGIDEALLREAHTRFINEIKHPTKSRVIDPADRTSMCQRKAVLLADAFTKARQNDFSDIPQAFIATLLHQRGKNMFDWTTLRLNLIDAGLISEKTPASKNALRQLHHQLEKQHALDLATPVLTALQAGSDPKSIMDTSKPNASDWLTDKGRALINEHTIEQMKQYDVLLQIYHGLPDNVDMANPHDLENEGDGESAGPAYICLYRYNQDKDTWEKKFILHAVKGKGYDFGGQTITPWFLKSERECRVAGFPDDYEPQDVIVLHCARDGFQKGENFTSNLSHSIWPYDDFNIDKFLMSRLQGESIGELSIQPVHLSFITHLTKNFFDGLEHLPTNPEGISTTIALDKAYDSSYNHPLTLQLDLPGVTDYNGMQAGAAINVARGNIRYRLDLSCKKNEDGDWVVDPHASRFQVGTSTIDKGVRHGIPAPMSNDAWDFLWNRIRPYIHDPFTPYTAKRFALLGITPDTFKTVKEAWREPCMDDVLKRRYRDSVNWHANVLVKHTENGPPSKMLLFACPIASALKRPIAFEKPPNKIEQPTAQYTYPDKLPDNIKRERVINEILRKRARR